MARPKPIIPVDQLERMLQEFGDDALDTMEGQAMLQLTNDLEAKAVELAPNLIGELEASTTVRVEQRGKRIIGVLTFGAPHASRAHERPDEERGPRTKAKPGNEFGQAGPKYLERPLRGFQESMTKDLGKALQDVLKRVKVTGRRG